MLGRTHMAVGALGAAVAAPILLHASTASIKHIGNLHTVESLIAVILAGAVGGLLPDMDQKDAKASRKVERIGELACIVIIVGILAVFHLWVQPVAWVIGLFAYGSAIHHAEWMRKLSLLILAAGALYIAMKYSVWSTSMFFAMAWLIGATFTSHRTFTHSILGTGVALGAFIGLGTNLDAMFLIKAVMLGYILHLVADAIAGGIPWLWPYRKRQGLRLVKTGDWLDLIIGSGSIVLTVIVAFVR